MTRWALATLAVLAVLPCPAGAQSIDRDAWVVPTGTIHAGLALDYSSFGSRFGESGTEPWPANVLHPLTASNFAPLAMVRARLDKFLDATGGGGPVVGESLSLGTPDVVVSADSRLVPLELGLGVLPRVELGVTVPIFRSEVQFTRFALSGGTVGGNPAPEANAAALAAFGPEFEELGRSRLLPLASSPLGQELRRRVRAAGGEIVLPAAPPAGDSLLNAILAAELGMPPLATFREPWRVGDAEATVRVRVLGTFGESAFPADSVGIHYRLTATAGARLPTGTEPDTLRLLNPSPAVGLSGWSAGMAGDLFVGRRLWLGSVVRYSAARPVDVLRRITAPDAPLASPDPPRAVRWAPPSELRLRVSPRLRLEEVIAVGLDFEVLRIGESSFTGADGTASVLNGAGGSVQRIGGSVRLSTLARNGLRSGGIPVDGAVSYTRTLAGPAGHPAASALRAEMRVYHRLWGR